MKAVHLCTEGVCDEHEATLVEMTVRFTEGVADVASIHSLHLVSVLYDELRTSPARIIGEVRHAGFDAHEYRRQPALSLAS